MRRLVYRLALMTEALGRGVAEYIEAREKGGRVSLRSLVLSAYRNGWDD